MWRVQRIGGAFCLAALVVLALAAGWSGAADRGKAPAPDAEAVDLFPAIEAKQIAVQVIPKDATECNILVTNKTDKPLSVRLPQAFAAAPVLAQFAPMNGPNKGNQPGANKNGAQPLGMPGMNNGNNNMMGGPGGGPMNVNGGRNGQRGGNNLPGFWNIPPEQVAKLKVPAVCLAHGAPNPRPQIPYELKPIESVSSKPGVAEVCAALGRSDTSHRAVQLAAWHLANDMSWEKLASSKQKLAFSTTPAYSQQELQAAKKLAESAVQQAKKSKPGPSASATAMQ